MVDRAPIRIAVLVSGRGTALQNLIERQGREFTIARVVCSRADAPAIQRAREAGIVCDVVPRGEYADVGAFSAAVFSRLEDESVDLVCLAGWLWLLAIPARFAGRVMNIHPSLLPDFGGRGMYGGAVHRAVLASGRRRSGCTVHFVDDEYDRGPIILQRACEVRGDDTAASLAARVAELEREAYPAAIALFAAGRLRVENGRVEIL